LLPCRPRRQELAKAQDPGSAELPLAGPGTPSYDTDYTNNYHLVDMLEMLRRPRRRGVIFLENDRKKTTYQQK
jgi:hypothetical protein